MNWTTFIEQSFEEDVREGDHTSLSCVPQNAMGEAALRVKQPGIIAGTELAKLIFHHYDPSLEIVFFIHDGEQIQKGDIVFQVKGKDRSILTCERLVLNCMQRMSGIATLTNEYVNLVAGTGVKILDTRKTTPLFRAAEKWAVRIGGGYNHRHGLYDMILIKDNHVDFAGGISAAVEKAKNYLSEKKLQLDIEVEVRNFFELEQLLACTGVKRVMLDNFSVADVQQAVQIINHQLEIEVSGGINLQTVKSFADCKPNFISVGALTHGYTSIDLSLKAIRN